jgi:hypothetical protein
VGEAPIQKNKVEIGRAVETGCQGRGIGETLDRKATTRQLVGESLSIEFIIFDEEDPHGVGPGPKAGRYRFGRRETPDMILGTVGHVTCSVSGSLRRP